MIPSEVGLRIGVLVGSDDVEGSRLAALLGVSSLPGVLALVRAHVLLARTTEGALVRWRAARTVVVADGPPAPGPFARWILPDQETARTWVAAGIPLGRLVVVHRTGDSEERTALLAVLHEVASTAARPHLLSRRDARRFPG